MALARDVVIIATETTATTGTQADMEMDTVTVLSLTVYLPAMATTAHPMAMLAHPMATPAHPMATTVFLTMATIVPPAIAAMEIVDMDALLVLSTGDIETLTPMDTETTMATVIPLPMVTLTPILTTEDTEMDVYLVVDTLTPMDTMAINRLTTMTRTLATMALPLDLLNPAYPDTKMLLLATLTDESNPL